ncbi:hypothetical protein [Syntrophotalea acetylenica]|jgi:hypothetical protein|uniref:hypothetical protein n=1 Tax=Syntrophotalea TaxID=2812025 RepID=UPI002A36B157|nr:hypothetical protein [Syntrophotalea acetylenica]MDY0262869.1 hypothetical protein [Syntrophotalea acetylenica]
MKKGRDCKLYWFFVLLIVLGAGCVRDVASAVDMARPQDAVERWTLDEFFTCEVPVQWIKEKSLPETGMTVGEGHGVILHSPWPGEVPVTISLHYYAEGRPRGHSLEAFVREHSRPFPGNMENARSEAPRELLVDGKKALSFTRQQYRFVPLVNILGPSGEPSDTRDPRVYESRERMARAVTVLEQVVVVPVSSGFYALVYSAPEADAEVFGGVFRRILSTFQTLQP